MAYSGSASDRLARVRAAIDDALTAQSYSVRGRAKSSARLSELRAMEKELQQEADAESAGSMFTLAVPMRAR